MSDYVVSARKYRPDSFESLIGQDNIARTLKNSIQRGQLAHAYLFCGPRGVGKTSAARIFAKTINCANPGPDLEPCGECDSCRSFAEGRSYCIHELDAASNNGVDDIKNLMDQVQIPPQVGRYSVYIIDEVHMLSQSAFNAFLKTLEEPPAHAIFILATTEKHKILPTILSRCQTYDFNRIGVSDIVRNLRDIARKEGISVDDESLHVIAHKADGAMRDALTLFDQTVAFCGTDVHYEDVIRNLGVLDYDYSFRLVDASLAGDYASSLLIFDEILSKGFNAQHFVAALSSHLRDLLVSRTGGLESLLDLPESLRVRYREQGERCSVKWLYDALGVTTACDAGYRLATNPRLHIEFALMRLAFLQQAPAAAPARGGQQDPETSGAAGPLPTTSSSGPSLLRSRGWLRSQDPATAPTAQASAAKAQKPSDSRESGSGAVPPETVAARGLVNGRGPADRLGGMSEAKLSGGTGSDADAEADGKKQRTPKKASSLSLSALLGEPEPEVMPAVGPEEAAPEEKPTEETLGARWKELSALYGSQPRLANALAQAKLSFREEDGRQVIEFTVTNEAQKKWIEERILRDLEDKFAKLAGTPRVRLQPVVIPEEEQGPRIYMPSEKAEVLISTNEEVRNLVVDLGLDVK